MKITKLFWRGSKLLIGVAIIGVAMVLLLDHFGVVETVKTYVVMSGSMEPAVRLGSVVVARPQASYRPGDIVSFAPDGNKDQIVTHRVVFRRYINSMGYQAEPSGIGVEPVYLTAGDANQNLDRWELTKDQIIGRVFISIPYLGYLVNFAKQPYGFILLVIVPATIVIYEELKYVLRELLQLLRAAKNKLVSWKLKSPQISPRNISINLLPRNEGRYPQAGVVISTVGAVLVLAAFSGAFYSDEEPSTGNVFSAAEFFGSAPGDVVINEVYYDVCSPAVSCGIEPDNEWVELFNNTPATLDISAWTLTDNNKTVTIPSSTFLSANSFVVITPAESTWSFWPTVPSSMRVVLGAEAAGKIGNGLSNTGDKLLLKDLFGTTIDAISYENDLDVLDPSISPVGSGHSIERDPDGVDTDTAADFIDRSPPTPGS